MTWGNDFFSFLVEGCRFIVLNSQLFKDGSRAAVQAQEQQVWLEQQLAEEQGRLQPCIILSHIPPFIHSRDENESWCNWPMEMRKYTLDLAKAAGVNAWFAGHFHQNAGGHDGSLEIVVTSAVGTTIDAQGEDFSQGLPPDLGQRLRCSRRNSGFRLVHVSNHVRHRWFSLAAMPDTIGPALFSNGRL